MRRSQLRYPGGGKTVANSGNCRMTHDEKTVVDCVDLYRDCTVHRSRCETNSPFLSRSVRFVRKRVDSLSSSCLNAARFSTGWQKLEEIGGSEFHAHLRIANEARLKRVRNELDVYLWHRPPFQSLTFTQQQVSLKINCQWFEGASDTLADKIVRYLGKSLVQRTAMLSFNFLLILISIK